jgi:hypothetical protein
MTPSQLFKTNMQRWNYATWLNVEKGFLYIETPKVACTKVKLTLQEISLLPLPENKENIHHRKNGDFVGSIGDHIDDCDLLLENKELLKFCFVRHPTERLVSAFKDKIQRSRGPFWERYRAKIRELMSLSDNSEIHFEHFVEWVRLTGDSSRDIHWRSQYNLLRPDVINYDRIGKMESFNEDFSAILNILGVPDTEKFVQGRENSTIKWPEVKTSSDTLSVIDEIYARDFQFFGY